MFFIRKRFFFFVLVDIFIMSKKNNSFGNFLGNFFDEKALEKIQNIISDPETMAKVTSLASQMGSQLINCQSLSQILDSDPKFTDEYLTEEIHRLKETQPDIGELIDKYLRSYENKENSEKSVYQIRRFLQSGDCQKALEDPRVKKHLQQLFNSPEFQKKFQDLFKINSIDG